MKLIILLTSIIKTRGNFDCVFFLVVVLLNKFKTKKRKKWFNKINFCLFFFSSFFFFELFEFLSFCIKIVALVSRRRSRGHSHRSHRLLVNATAVVCVFYYYYYYFSLVAATIAFVVCLLFFVLCVLCCVLWVSFFFGLILKESDLCVLPPIIDRSLENSSSGWGWSMVLSIDWDLSISLHLTWRGWEWITIKYQ